MIARSSFSFACPAGIFCFTRVTREFTLDKTYYGIFIPGFL